MDPNIIILKFISSLPPKEALLCITLRAYETELKAAHHSEHQNSIIRNLYETAIRNLLKINQLPIYDSQDMKKENAEKSTVHEAQDQTAIEDPFEAKLGKWASSISNNSDLSSDDELEQAKKIIGV